MALWGCTALFAGCLYFFENDTGTRIVFVCAMLFPLLPPLRRILWGRKRNFPASRPLPAVLSRRLPEEEDPGDVRPWLPGDPLNRIHWKLSAKRDELMVRPAAAGPEQENRPVPPPSPAGRRSSSHRRLPILAAAGFLALCAFLLLLLPDARQGFLALCNRLFAASEKVNAYVYGRFPVPAGQPLIPAVLLLAGMLLLLLFLLLYSGSRLLAVILAAVCVLFQVYFGLPLSGWCQVVLFTLLSLWMARPVSLRGAVWILCAVLAVSLAVVLFLPGVNAGTEEASERARDALSRAAGRWAGSLQEAPEGITETRHVQTLSLVEGDLSSSADKAYRLFTEDERQISMPRWFDWIKTVFLFLAVAVLPLLPFLPFIWLNAKRRKAADARKAFLSGDAGPAVQSAFRHVIAWLEAMDAGGGNTPYRDWTEPLSSMISADYAARFRPCAEIFEKAVYSPHPVDEAERGQVVALLDETERILRPRADRKQRFRLKYMEFLWL